MNTAPGTQAADDRPPLGPSDTPRDPLTEVPANDPLAVPTDPPVPVPSDVPFDVPSDLPPTDDEGGLPIQRPPEDPDDFPEPPTPGQ